jgi:hypothetical protein
MAGWSPYGLVRWRRNTRIVVVDSNFDSGSNIHCMRALRHPRWEDFNYERLDKTGNRLYWLGDGMSYHEKTFTGDSTFIPVPLIMSGRLI